MDDEATQPTQDPRRQGFTNSGLAHEDVSDLLCILHPCSPAAFKIVAHTALRCPQNVLQTRSFDDYDDGVSQSVLEEQETFILGSDSAAQAMDLALRFSAKVVRPHMGFVFGRNAAVCDIVVDTDTIKRVSNVHFRIFINESGSLMLEDLSTNGTVVDDVVLRSKDQARAHTRMLTPGSIIQILSPKAEEVVKFIVRIPNREGHEQEHQAKLIAYVHNMALAVLRAHDAAPNDVARRLRPANETHHSGPQKMGLTNKHFGMHWSGGEKYNVVGQIGKGAFATVYQIATKNDGQLYAAKELEKRRFMKNGMLDRKVNNEMQIMKAIQHENVVQYVEYQDVGHHLYIIMEFVPCGDLQQYLHRNPGPPEPIPEDLGRKMSAQVFDALDYLHKKKITHRDIKPDNILIADLDPDNFTIKLSDFGLSKIVKDNEDTFLKTFCGTLLYCAPEVFPHYDAHVAGNKKRPHWNRNAPTNKFHSYSQSVDIWSYGAVLWFSLCVKPPFEGVADNTGKGMFDKIMMTALDPTDLTKQGVSDYAVALLMEMLNTDPATRPTPAYCLSHPWFGDERVVLDGAAEFAVGLAVINEEHEFELVEQPDMSQLSIGEEEDDHASEVSLHSGDIQFFDPRQSKRFKSEAFAYRDREGSLIGSSPEVLFDHIPIMNQAAPMAAAASAGPAPPKLFGEISQSALDTSSVFGNRQHPELDSMESRSSSSGGSHRSTHHAQEDSAVASASLMGAESMVRDLHMDSPNHPGSSPGGEVNEPTTPVQEIEQHTPNEITPRPAQPKAFSPVRPTPQRVFSRQIQMEFPPSIFYDSSDPNTHNLEYASRASGHDFSVQPRYLVSSRSLDHIKTEDLDVEPQTQSLDSTTSAETTQEDSPSEAELLLAYPRSHFLKPPPRLGRLTPLPGGFSSVPLILTTQEAHWGRAPSNTHVFPDPTDIRVARRALIFKWHAPPVKSVSKDSLTPTDARTVVADPDAWTKAPNLHCMLSTESRTGVRVNGTLLHKPEPDGTYYYGRIYTGDVIEILKESKGKPGLGFVVELHQGEGKAGRPVGEETFKEMKADAGKGAGETGKQFSREIAASGGYAGPADKTEKRDALGEPFKLKKAEMV
ncbi:Protein kinase protein rad53 [Oleoguttula sp. CCFEE 5521]